MPRRGPGTDRFSRPHLLRRIMRRSPFAAALPVVAVVLTLTGCAATAPVETPAASPTSAPSATPTIEPIVIGPAEMPPVPFDGDCAKALTPEDIAAVTGRNLLLDEFRNFEPLIDNVGGLRCSWSGDGGQMAIAVMPRSGLDGAEIPAELTATYFEDCGWVCSWQGGDDAVWTAVSFQFDDGMTREVVDGWGSTLGPRVVRNYVSSAGEPWVRDRTGWWPTFECQALADAVGTQLGTDLVGLQYGPEHLGAPEQTLAILAGRETACILQDAGGELNLLLSTEAGLGGSFREAPESAPTAPVDLGVPGITAQTRGESGFSVADGVNRADLYVYESALPLRDIAVAVAAAAASDFQ
ncbi:DUF3558 domain-containing protein [Microbacterium sp. SSM24]|uniref:DUF3558 domain-containing protein n=1 Tax=Microbacterium sp. SSM24 TaxID=2991714 RepID=UPI002226730A|nr:DUF3558 domain-containing protein [Microbacterium sp. SSM24]MCW3492442.1 DUF3558 domain-containing protein [Microbacterium sp. SSM24]